MPASHAGLCPSCHKIALPAPACPPACPPAGQLLDHAGGYVDPLRLVGALPPALPIPRLRGRLVKVIADSRTAQCLQQARLCCSIFYSFFGSSSQIL